VGDLVTEEVAEVGQEASAEVEEEIVAVVVNFFRFYFSMPFMSFQFNLTLFLF